jgi:hypothetical protein
MQEHACEHKYNPVDKLLMTHEQVVFLAGSRVLRTNTGALVHKAGVFLTHPSP